MVTPMHTAVEAVFEDAKDKNVSTYVLYGQATKLYIDPAFETEAEVGEVLDALIRGVLIYTEANGYSTVTSFKESDGTLTVKVGTVTYTVGSDVTTASVESKDEH